MALKVLWTKRADKKFDKIIAYLLSEWNEKITIQPADETDYILSNPVYAKVLKDRISEYEDKKQTISLIADDLL